MKSFNTKKLITMTKCLTVGLMLLTSTISYAGGWSGSYNGHQHRWDGWHKVAENDGDNGHHYGHDNKKGKHKGFKKGKHHWHSVTDTDTDADDSGDTNQNTGVSVDLTVHDYALNPGTTFNVSYNSLQTVQDVLTDLLGTETAGYVLQQCYQYSDPLAGTYTDCTSGETLNPLDGTLTLDAAGLVADPVVYLVKQ